MTSNEFRGTARATCLNVDWAKVTYEALGSAIPSASDPIRILTASLVGSIVRAIGEAIELDDDRVETEVRVTVAVEDAPTMPSVEPDVLSATIVLGISPDATEDAIRAALREKLTSSGAHPDQGGDAEEAKRLIAAKNLLIERARKSRP